MVRIIGLSRIGLALAALVALVGVSMSTGPANAVVYCETAGVPRGCIVRPIRQPVVYCKTVGVPKGCVVRR
jgi:hypothetical protein